MKMYKISEELVQGLIAYLMTQPYKDVAKGIVDLQGLQVIEGEETTESE